MSRRDKEKPTVQHINIGTLYHKDHSKEELNKFIKSQLNKIKKDKDNRNDKDER